MDNKLYVIFPIWATDDILEKEKKRERERCGKNTNLKLSSFLSKANHIFTPEFRRVKKYNFPQGGAANILTKYYLPELTMANIKRI